MASQDLISLHSDAGQKLLADVKSGQDGSYQHFLHDIFAKQATNITCGIASFAMVMSAHAASKLNLGSSVDRSNLPYLESNMFSYPETLAVTSLSQLRANGGLTLDRLHDLFISHGCKIKLRHAADSSPEEFRSDIIAALNHHDSASGVVINYKQDVLGQGVPYGHISPLVAYHASTDRVLILDTWPETEECWAKVDDLFIAMNTIDEECGKTRGYIVVNF